MTDGKERVEIPIKVSFSEKDSFRAKFGEVQKVQTNNYEELYNKPKIEGNVLIGDKTFKQLGLGEITPADIDDMMLDDLIAQMNGGN